MVIGVLFLTNLSSTPNVMKMLQNGIAIASVSKQIHKINQRLNCMSQKNRNVEHPISSPNLFAVKTKQHLSVQQSKSFELVMAQMNISAPEDFKQAFSQQWKTAADKKQLLSVLLCEIDYYQEYVDHYGVQGASFMLISIALSLKNICETHNCFLSHNEQHGFTVLFKGGTVQQAQAIGESLCEVVNNSKTEHKHTQVGDFITLSVGISSVFPSTKSVLKKEAKDALNEAQVIGGNTVNSSNSPSKEVRKSTKIDNLQVDTVNKIESNQDHFFAKSEQEIAPKNTHTKLNYRGQSIENKQQEQQVDALTLNKVALNESNIDSSQKTKKRPVRMYRGQIVTD